MTKWRCVEPCDGGCIISSPHDENHEGWKAETLEGQLCKVSKWLKDGDSMHDDFILGRSDLENLKKLKTDFINSIMLANIRYSACGHISSELNYLLRTWEEPCVKR